MATRKEASERLVDLILQLVIENDALSNIARRVINPDTGEAVVVYDNWVEGTVDANAGQPPWYVGQDSLLYGDDYRPSAFNKELSDLEIWFSKT